MAKITLLFLMVLSSLFGHSIEVQGHRGSRGTLPENTLPAFANAISNGVDALELDILASKEGELVIYHDYFVNPQLSIYMDGKQVPDNLLLCQLPLAEIKKIDCGRKSNPNFPQQHPIPGTKIPTLKELFLHLKTSKDPKAKTVRLNLEIKREPTHPEYTLNAEELASKVIQEVKEHGMAKRVYYSSFDPNVLIEIKKLDPYATIALLIDEESLGKVQALDPNATIELFGQMAKRVGASIISPEHIYLQERNHVRSLQSLGLKVITWTVNDANQWKELIEIGVDGIITDYPQDLISYLNQENR